jgi:flagellar P-ring protein precursor FlgI
LNIRVLVKWLVVLAVLGFAPSAHADKVRDLVDLAGARENQLVGYGLVTGLAQTGDDFSVPFAAQSIMSLLRRLGVQVDPTQLQQMRLRNVAAVVVTATLPPFAKPGTRIDVTVSSLGNARSLSGGVLVQTVLKGPDLHPYAVAQGSLLVGGYEAKGATGSYLRAGQMNAGRIAEGALVEREVPTALVTNGTIRLELRIPGFTVAARIAEAVNTKLGPEAARPFDGGSVDIKVPAEYTSKIVELMAVLEELDVIPLRRARVVINERTGTIVAGGDVRLAPVAVVHGSLTIVVKETQTPGAVAAIPGGLGVSPNGAGAVVGVGGTRKSDITASEGNHSLTYVPAAPTLSDVATALSQLGLSPRELTSVLQALRGAGALEAEVVVQ